MPAVCKACGDRVREPTQYALEGLGCKNGLPAWLAEICLTCLYDLASYVDSDEDGYPLREITPDEFNRFLADRIAIMAQRIASGRTVERCEVIAGGWYRNDPEDLRCRRFACGEWHGRLVCGPHRLALKKGRDVGFIDSGWKRTRPYLIWARDPADLVAQARLIAEADSKFVTPGQPVSTAPA